MTYFHRTSRTSTLDWVRGRDAVVTADLADAAASAGMAVLATTIDRMLAQRFSADGEVGWSRHRWYRREGAFIVDETVVDDGGGRCRVLGLDFDCEVEALAANRTIHPPLGELRAGTGQLAVGGEALLPPGLPAAIRPLADAMHRAWNGRDPGALAPLWDADVDWTGPDGAGGDRAALGAWIMRLIGRFDDAVLLFEDAVVDGDHAALLWRLHGHHSAEAFGVPPGGARIRLIGSTMVRFSDGRIVEDETLIDSLAAAVQLRSPTLDY